MHFPILHQELTTAPNKIQPRWVRAPKYTNLRDLAPKQTLSLPTLKQENMEILLRHYEGQANYIEQTTQTLKSGQTSQSENFSTILQVIAFELSILLATNLFCITSAH